MSSDDDEAVLDIVSGTESVARKGINKVRKVTDRVVDGLVIPGNTWHLWLSALTTGFCAFNIFTVSTIVRGLYGDSWIGSVAIGTIYGTMVMLASAFAKKGVMPTFDIVGILVNLSVFNLKARRRNGTASLRADLHIVPAVILFVTLLLSGFASAGISYAILGKTAYEGAAKVPNFADYTWDKAFFIEFFGMTVFYIFIQQMTLIGSRIEFTALFSSFYWVSLQAIGYDISSASYNFVYWLTVNTIGFHADFWSGWYVYLGASAATVGAVLVINKLLFFLYNAAIRHDTTQHKLAQS